MITLVTHRGLPNGAPDDLLLKMALEDAGLPVRFAVWDDSSVDWSATPLAIIRSTWDYHRSPDRWRSWIDEVEHVTRLANSSGLLRWNTDKRYLAELVGSGVPCIPTCYIEANTRPSLAKLALARRWSDVVVKPAIGASAYGAGRFTHEEIAGAGETHLRQILQNGAALVQPYLPAVETARERSLVFVGGQLVHAFSKPSFNTDAAGGTRIEPHDATPDEVALGVAALSAAPGGTQYARVDLVPSNFGPLLMELELIEPDLGIRACSTVAERFVETCESMLLRLS